MILPKNRESDRLRARIGATSEDALVSGRAYAQTTTRSVRISLELPLAEGMALLERLRSGASAGQIPIVLWSDRKGDMQVAVRASRSSADPSMTARAYEDPEPARPNMPRLASGELVIDPGRHEVTFKGKPIPPLTFTEFGILHLLARHPGWVFNRQQIVSGVRGEDYPVTDRAVDVQIAGLRKKMGDAASYIQTVRGVGYRFRDLG